MGKERESANLVSTLTGIAVTISGDPVVLGIGSTEHLRLHDDGRIGFGTNSAIAKLDIRGGVTQDGGEECLMVASSDPQNIPSTITTGYSYGTLQVFGGGMAGSSRRGGQIDFIAGGGVIGIDTGALLFRTGLTTAGGTSQPERVRISAAGLVGIATTSNLTAKLTVGNIENSSVTDKGATAFKTLNSSGGVGESAIYLEEQSGSEGWYLKVNSSGDLQFNDSGVSDRITFQDGGNIGIGTDNPTEKLSVAGNVRVENSADAAQYLTINYQGIDFQNTGAGSSTSSSAHLLDDYEEGTWTPVFAGNTTSGTYTYTTQLGRYTKIGNTVTVHGTLQDINTVSGGTGPIRIRGLPFVSSADQVFPHGVARLEDFDVQTGAYDLNATMIDNGTELVIVVSRDALVAAAVQSTGKLSNTADIYVSCTYRSA